MSSVVECFKEPVFYVPGASWIIDAVNPETLKGQYSSLSLEEIRQEHPAAICIEGDDAFERIARINHERLIAPKARTISEDDWMDALCCLPPCRYGSTSGITHFHISERLTGNIVAWFTKDRNGNCVRFNDLASIPLERVVERHGEACLSNAE